jgi:hypothetical protein
MHRAPRRALREGIFLHSPSYPSPPVGSSDAPWERPTLPRFRVRGDAQYAGELSPYPQPGFAGSCGRIPGFPSTPRWRRRSAKRLFVRPCLAPGRLQCRPLPGPAGQHDALRRGSWSQAIRPSASDLGHPIRRNERNTSWPTVQFRAPASPEGQSAAACYQTTRCRRPVAPVRPNAAPRRRSTSFAFVTLVGAGRGQVVHQLPPASRVVLDQSMRGNCTEKAVWNNSLPGHCGKCRDDIETRCPNFHVGNTGSNPVRDANPE